MKILVDEMPACKNDCWFMDKYWADGNWKPCCILGPDDVTNCDLENGKCSKLKLSCRLNLMTATPYENVTER